MKLYPHVLAVLLTLVSVPAESAGIGSITEQINSPGEVLRQTTKLVANKGTGIEMNDSVRTQQGKVGITFEDNTRVQVNENSKLVIDDFVYDPKSKTGKVAMKMADRKSTRLNSSHSQQSRMPSSA